MTWVKVCGLSRPEEVAAALDAGADAIGFVVFPGSPRFITPTMAAELGDGVEAVKVLVSVGLTPQELLAAAETARVNGVQPSGEHAEEAAQTAVEHGLFVLRTVPVSGPVDLSQIPVDQMPLLDTAVAGLHGGTGQSFAWGLSAAVRRDYVLAGGLDPGTVGDAVSLLHPWGVDASTGLESAPGVKDLGRVRTFVREAKRA